MGKRGPKPTPTSILKLRGSWKANERKDEPTPEPAIPDKPRNLTGPASAEWDRITKVLFGLGIITRLDRIALVMYCEAFAEWSQLGETVERVGMFYERKDGSQALHPASKARNFAFAQLSKSMAELGLSPASRTKVKSIKPNTDADGKARFFPKANG